MPMSREAKFDKVQRLLTAHGRTKKALESEPVVWEMHPGTEIAQAWPVITAAYSGLEQTIKFLIAEERDLTVQELFDSSIGEKGQAHEGARRTHPYRTHNLGRLFAELEEPTKETVREFFARYESLHPHIGIGKVDQFLHRVSGTKGDGYARWRYALIEEKALPASSPSALVAIWGVSVRIAQERAWGNRHIRMPDAELSRQLCTRLKTLAEEAAREVQSDEYLFRDVRGEINAWFRKRGDPLTAMAEILWYYARHGNAGASDAPDWLEAALTRWAEETVDQAASDGPTLLRSFVVRAQGHTRHGESVRWNAKKKRFESVPWSLKKRFRDAAPANATVIEHRSGGYKAPMWGLWSAAEECGYRVRENRSFTGPPNMDPWFCTLEVTTESNGREEPIISMWQQKRNVYDDRFHMEHECNQEGMSQSVRWWIDAAQRLGKLSTE